MNKVDENPTDLCNILLKWLQTFDLQSPHKRLEDITDGAAMAEALHQIAPEFFNESWLSKIKTDCGDNWRLKVSNLRKIVKNIVDYYQECFNIPLTEFAKPDVTKIGDQGDPAEIARLLQLILWCAVNCNHKKDYITRILKRMDECEQQVIMKSIQELENIHGPGPVSFSASLGFELEPQVQQLMSELQAANEARDQMTQRCLELDLQVSLLQEEKTSLLEDKKRLLDRIQESVDDPSTVTLTGQLRRQVDTLKDEIITLENSRDDYRLKLEIQEKDMQDLQLKIDELQQTAVEARHLKDEVDVLRETADKVEKYEATIQIYKQKMEELSDLKREIKSLESKNLAYIEQNIAIEKEVSKSAALKTQVEIYKQQVAELHKKLNEETKRADKLEFENKKVQDQLNAVKREKESLMSERHLLKESKEELECQLQLTMGVESGIPVPNQSNLFPEESLADIKQKYLALQHENNILRKNQRGPEDEKASVIQSLLDDSVNHLNQLRLENRQANQRIMELEEELKEASDRESGVASLKAQLTDLQNKLQREKDKKQLELEEKDLVIAEKKQHISLLQETLNQKEQESQDNEDKFRKYKDKAIHVMKAMDNKHNSISNDNIEVATLKNQLIEKQKLIDELKKENDRNKLIKEHEEKLMSSVFHNLGQVKHKESVDQRLTHLNLGQSHSFLARQRQSTGRHTPGYNSK
ncbi:protein Hook homolog [Nilaparvata lugens]|uniref:protein Hook homolog n=1 Tax=Nilaparvata lugens TaxID=108931 RepID=UPI00193CA941|nr:protein Hook homolog [Nilaparvata lugens]